MLTKRFVENITRKEVPFGTIGEFVYLRTYSRYLEDKKRRENWGETCERVSNYNISLEEAFRIKNNLPINKEKLQEEAELLFTELYNLRSFTSGRTLYIGGTEIVKEYPLANYNCAFTDITKFEDFIDEFYLLMVGSGVGLGLTKENISQLPNVRKVSLEHVHYPMYSPKNNVEDTYTEIKGDTITINVGDSKEGWCKSLQIFFDVISKEEYANISKVIVDYSFVRPEGTILKRFGGRASGHKSLQRMFEKIGAVIEKVVDNKGGKLAPIDALDVATIISENVVSGGVRRSALMIVCDEDDEEVITAKRNLYTCVDGNWIEDASISHRRMSNNSIVYHSKPSLEKIKEILASIKVNGEPGFINGYEAKNRKSSFRGTNPCGEILLKSKTCCNLVTNNLLAFVKDGKLDVEDLKNTLRMSTRVAIRMTLVDVELPEWDKAMKSDRIIGVSLTGVMDMFNAVNYTYDELAELLAELRDVVHEEGNAFSKELGIEAPSLMTTFKPEGTISNLPGVSSGVHYSHAPYYVRRVRVSVTDPLYKAVEGNFPTFNEVGQTDENCTTKVVEFPVKAPQGRTKYDVSALEQLELYKITMKNWTDHNTSITVHVRDNEWDAVAEWLYENFDDCVGITFLPLFEETYPLLPYQAISEEEYLERVKAVKGINLDILTKLEEQEYQEQEILESGCEGGICPIR